MRILALDLLRGYFLFVIAIDHLYLFPGVFELLTGRGQLWASAAEGFFLISGALVGYIYGPRILNQAKNVFQKLWRRAGKIYLCSITLTILFTYLGNLFYSPLLKSGLWTGGPSVTLTFNILTLNYVYGWADFLPYYAVFLFFAPAAVYLAAKNMGWLVAGASLIIWLLRGTNFYLAWQLMFFSGLLFGFYLPVIENKLMTLKKFLYPAAIVVVIVNAMYLWLSNNYTNPWFDKDTLAPGRIIVAWLWFLALFLFVRSHEEIISRVFWGFFRILGQNSLLVYVSQAVILFILEPHLPKGGPIFQNFAIDLLVIILLFLVAKIKTLLPTTSLRDRE